MVGKEPFRSGPLAEPIARAFKSLPCLRATDLPMQKRSPRFGASLNLRAGVNGEFDDLNSERLAVRFSVCSADSKTDLNDLNRPSVVFKIKWRTMSRRSRRI